MTPLATGNGHGRRPMWLGVVLVAALVMRRAVEGRAAASGKRVLMINGERCALD
jgi:MYXO-CTERM domain-containing protein